MHEAQTDSLNDILVVQMQETLGKAVEPFQADDLKSVLFTSIKYELIVGSSLIFGLRPRWPSKKDISFNGTRGGDHTRLAMSVLVHGKRDD